MEKTIEYIKKNYILCMVFVATFLVVVGSIIIIKMLVPKTEYVTPKVKEVSYYNFFETKRYDFKAKQTYENDKMTMIECSDCNSNGNNGILYYKDKSKVTLDDFFSIVFYYQNSISYLVPMFTELENDAGTNVITIEGKQYLTDDFFLFNGEDIYFFVSDVTLSVNGQKYELNKYSYVSARSDEIIYYNYGSNNPVILNNVTSSSIRVGSVDIDLLKGVVVDQNKRIILSNEVNSLPEFKEI